MATKARAPRKNTVIVTTERVIQTRNTILCTDAELAALRACGGELNADVLAFVDDHSGGKDKDMLTATVTVHRCKIEGSDEGGSTTCFVKWGTDDLVEE